MTKFFQINCEVMAAISPDLPDAVYGTFGVLFADKEEYQKYLSSGMRVMNLYPSGCFNHFRPSSSYPEGLTYRAVGEVANIAVGYPATDVVTVDETGTTHSEVITNLNLSGSTGNTVAFSPIGNFSEHFATDVSYDKRDYYQRGDAPAAGSTSIHLAFSGDTLAWDYTSTFSSPSTAFDPDTPLARADASSRIHTTGTATGIPNLTPPNTLTREFSGSFTYEPSYFFSNA